MSEVKKAFILNSSTASTKPFFPIAHGLRPDPDVELLVQSLNANLAQKSITISVTDDAKKWILEKTLTDRSYGRARCAARCSATWRTRFRRR